MTHIFATQALTAIGWADNVRLTLDGMQIAEVETGASPRAGDRRVSVLLPAPANIHSHAFQRAMAGMTEARGADPTDSFWTWRKLMYRFMERLTPDDNEAIAALVQMEMLEAGYGASVEFHYLHHQPGGTPYANLAEMAERICAAAATSGIGLTLAPVLYQYGGCDARPLRQGQERFGNNPDRYARLWAQSRDALAALPEDCRIAIAPHSLRAVGPDGLAAALALSEDAPVHIHIAEQTGEVDEVVAAWGQRPIEWLYDHADVNARWTLIHATQMEPHETEMVAASGAVAGLCPITEANLGDGIFDGVRFLDHGGMFAIGSDSNVRIGLNEELCQLEYSQRLRDRSRAALARAGSSTGRVLLDGAARGGARSAGRGAGVIAAGALADLVALDGDCNDLVGKRGDMALDAWIFARGDGAVRDVWSAGRHMVREGRHIRRDAIVAAYRKAVARLVA